MHGIINMWRSLANVQINKWMMVRGPRRRNGSARRARWQRLEPLVSYQCSKSETGRFLLGKIITVFTRSNGAYLSSRRKPSHQCGNGNNRTHYYDFPVMVIQALLRFVAYVAGSLAMRGNGSVAYTL